MDQQAQARYKAQAQIVKAMAHPTRLFIVDELSKSGERCVCELTEMIGTDMSTVSRHLSVLKEAGLIQDDKRGQMVYYRIRVNCIPNFFDCINSVIASNAGRQGRQPTSSYRSDPQWPAPASHSTLPKS